MCKDVGIFFVVDNKPLIHCCSLEESEQTEYFCNFPFSHYDIWNLFYINKYKVDFDYYPRGRIIFDKTLNIFRIFYDPCAEEFGKSIIKKYDKNCRLELDEHYSCHNCLRGYVK